MSDERAFSRPGSDLLSRVLRRSTISAGAFHGRVRNGIGCSRSAITTRSAKRTLFEKLFKRDPGIASLCQGDAFCRLPSGESPQARLRVAGFPAPSRSVRPKADTTRERWSNHRISRWILGMRTIKPIELLVPVSFKRCRSSTPGLSTWSSSTVLREYSF